LSSIVAFPFAALLLITATVPLATPVVCGLNWTRRT
jgi:hypothetical protein